MMIRRRSLKPRVTALVRAVGCGAVLVSSIGAPALAQDRGSLNPRPLPALAHPDDPKTPAKELFGRKTNAAAMKTQTIGFYSKGCLAGAKALPINGKTWQVMRLSRNRNWGHPTLVDFLERLSAKGAKVGWPGLLVGDMSQPRGGPMLTGHASHQIGLQPDAEPRVDARGARGDVGDHGGLREPQGRRSESLDARARRHHQGRRAGPGRRAHLRQCRDQEGALPRSRQRP